MKISIRTRLDALERTGNPNAKTLPTLFADDTSEEKIADARAHGIYAHRISDAFEFFVCGLPLESSDWNKTQRQQPAAACW